MFKEYQSKPITRKAREVTEDDNITYHPDESTSLLISQNNEPPVKFKHYEPVNVGDFIVYLNDDDVYHCTRKVFLERNIVPESE